MSNILCSLPDFVSVGKDVILTATAIVAACVGVRGLNTWRQQLKGNTEYTLAKSVLTSLYELRGAINAVRNPFISVSEEPNLPQERLRDMDEKQKQWHSYAQAYEKRWEPVTAARCKLDAQLFEVEAIWGQEMTAKVKPIFDLVHELHWAIQDHLEAKDPRRSNEDFNAEEAKKQRAIIFKRSSKTDDDFNRKLESAIDEVEVTLKPHVRQHHV